MVYNPEKSIVRPYTEEIKDGYVIREFTQTTLDDEFVWHRDREDRWVQAINRTDWKFQLDNQLPVPLHDNKLFIPKGTYHRLIKGQGGLVVKLWQE